MKYLLLLLLISCTTKQTDKPIEKPTQLKPELCKELEKPRYSTTFSKLVCALKKSKQNEPLKAIILAQFIKESGRGHSRLAMEDNNFGGLKFRKEMAAYGKPTSYTDWENKKDSYIKFDSIEAFIEGYWHFIDRYPYKGWDKYKNDPHGYIKFINYAGYTPPRDYYKDVIVLENEAKGLLK